MATNTAKLTPAPTTLLSESLFATNPIVIAWRAAAGTHKGGRKNNEDNYLLAQTFANHSMAIVADGMGGNAAGEVASFLTVDTVENHWRLVPSGGLEETEAWGRNALRATNAVVEAAGKQQNVGEKHRMGSTAVMAVRTGADLTIFNIGDSRAYLLHKGKLKQLTVDQTLVQTLVDRGVITKEQAQTHIYRHVLNSCMGHLSMEIAVTHHPVTNGDVLLLCSDGLSGALADEQIATILAKFADPQEAVDELIEAALRADASDNVTVVVVAM